MDRHHPQLTVTNLMPQTISPKICSFFFFFYSFLTFSSLAFHIQSLLLVLVFAVRFWVLCKALGLVLGCLLHQSAGNDLLFGVGLRIFTASLVYI